MKNIILFSLILSLAACSMSGQNNEQVVVNNDDLEFAVDTLADSDMGESEFQVVEEKIAESPMPTENTVEEVKVADAQMDFSEPKMDEFRHFEEMAAPATQEAPTKIALNEDMMMDPSLGQTEMYRVQKGDTLMMIAFKIYGDYRKWKELQAWNSHLPKISEGMELKYVVPEQQFGWMPSGSPYLVKTGDTLQIISMDKYGTTRKWKAIYDNNKPLIRNPNLIFAGFTIYYHPERDLASERK